MAETVFYSAIDGWTSRGTPGNWAGVRDGVGTAGGDVTSFRAQLAADTTKDYWNTITRGGVGFDTSSLGATAVIEGAVLRAKIGAVFSHDNHTFTVAACSFVPNDDTWYVAGDYALYGGSSWGTYQVGPDLPQILEIELLDTSFINKVGRSSLGLREYADLINVAPTWRSDFLRRVIFSRGTDIRLNVTWTSIQTATPASVVLPASTLTPLLHTRRAAVIGEAVVPSPLVKHTPLWAPKGPVALAMTTPAPFVRHIPFITYPAYLLPTAIYLTPEDAGKQYFVVRSRGDKPIFLRDVTDLVFRAYDLNNNLVLQKPGVVEDHANGVISLDFSWGDFPAGSGLYLLKAIIAFGGGRDLAFPSHDSFCYLILSDSFQ